MNAQESETTAAKTRVLIVDDHYIIRRGVTEMLNEQTDFTVGAAVSDANAAMEIVRNEPFDLAIVDISLGEVDGIELTQLLKAEHPDLAILILSMHEEALYADQAMRAGASGFVAKQHAGEVLLSAVRQVTRGQHYFSHLP